MYVYMERRKHDMLFERIIIKILTFLGRLIDG